jgi:hypothetical protein
MRQGQVGGTGCHSADGTGAMPGVADLSGPGGNPALTDDDLRATLDHLRRLTGVRHDGQAGSATP